jgi:hypothetical protein
MGGVGIAGEGKEVEKEVEQRLSWHTEAQVLQWMDSGNGEGNEGLAFSIGTCTCADCMLYVICALFVLILLSACAYYSETYDVLVMRA